MIGAVRPSATETIPKHKAMKFLVWDEKAIRTKKKRSRGSQVNQMEKLYILLPEQQTLSFRKRKYFAGTTHGDVIGPIIAPAWDESWFLLVLMMMVIVTRMMIMMVMMMMMLMMMTMTAYASSKSATPAKKDVELLHLVDLLRIQEV